MYVYTHLVFYKQMSNCLKLLIDTGAHLLRVSCQVDLKMQIILGILVTCEIGTAVKASPEGVLQVERNMAPSPCRKQRCEE